VCILLVKVSISVEGEFQFYHRKILISTPTYLLKSFIELLQCHLSIDVTLHHQIYNNPKV